MKIGVITFWNSKDNYGQLLQAWALQQWLKQNGHSPYIIRYIPTTHKSKKTYKYFLKVIAKTILIYPLFCKYINSKRDKKLKVLVANNEIKNQKRKFDDFRKDNLSFSPHTYYSLKELQNNPPLADVYITGSDQVWAQLLNNENNRAYFLDFGEQNIKRISYAPSFSMLQYPTRLQNQLSNNLTRFNAISVREKSGVEICRTVGYDAALVCDPTLLLTQKDYLKLISPKSDEKKYIYIYSLNIQKAEDIRWTELSKLSKTSNLDVKVTTASGYVPFQELFGNEVEYDYATIQQWLTNIQNAELVVTPSFHGIVFSILLHTPFIYVPLFGNFQKGNNRVTDLLEILHLNDRILDQNKTYTQIINKAINWDDVEKRLLRMKQNSELFLQTELV